MMVYASGILMRSYLHRCLKGQTFVMTDTKENICQTSVDLISCL